MADIEKKIIIQARIRDTDLDDKEVLKRHELQEAIEALTNGKDWDYTSVQRQQGGRLVIHIQVKMK